MEAPPGSISVLHVDDEPDFTELAAEFLTREAEYFTIETATCASDGLARLRAEEFDCVVSDYDMPDSNGIEFLEAVREEHSGLPFILYTGKGSEEVASEAITKGATDYLQKGGGTSQYAVLANRIENIVTQYRVQRDVESMRTWYRRLIEESTDVIVVVDPDGTFTYVSPAAERVFGYGSEELLGENAFDFVHAEDREETRDRFSAMIGDPSHGGSAEFRFDSKDGTFRWIEARARDLLDDPVVGGIVVYARNVTQRKERERTLERIVQRMGDLIDTVSKDETATVAVEMIESALDAPLAGIHLLSDDGQRLEAAAAVDEVRDEFGVPPTYDRAGEDISSRFVWDAFESGEVLHLGDIREWPDLREDTPARSAIICPLGGHGVLIVSRTEPDGFDQVDRNFVELVARMLTAALDRVERESAVREHNRRLERLHDTGQELMQADTTAEIAACIVAASEAILEFPITVVRYYDEDEGGLVVVTATEAVAEVLGTRPVFRPGDGSLNWSAYESGSPAIYEDISDIERAVDSGTALRSLMVVPLGEHGTVSIGTTTPGSFHESDVFLAQLLGTAAELALSRLAYETELIQQRDELDRQNERLDQFASMATHDLRNPLSIALGNLQLYRESGDQSRIETVEVSLNRLRELLTDLQALARDRSFDEDNGAVSISEVAREAWEMIDTRSATLRTEEGTVFGKRSQLQGLFENLFRNAVGHGGADVDVRVGPLEDGFYVADSGTGIPAEEREKVFEHGYTTGYGGSGVGLTIVGRIAQAHGWEMSLTESADGGARFEFRGTTDCREEDRSFLAGDT